MKVVHTLISLVSLIAVIGVLVTLLVLNSAVPTRAQIEDQLISQAYDRGGLKNEILVRTGLAVSSGTYKRGFLHATYTVDLRGDKYEFIAFPFSEVYVNDL